MMKIGAAVAAAIAAAFGASLCCIGPVLAVFVGVGGAGLAATFEPLRPYLLALSGVLLVLGGAALYGVREAATCAPDGSCPADANMRRKVVFWIGVGCAVILASFPWWSNLLL